MLGPHVQPPSPLESYRARAAAEKHRSPGGGVIFEFLRSPYIVLYVYSNEIITPSHFLQGVKLLRRGYGVLGGWSETFVAAKHAFTLYFVDWHDLLLALRARSITVLCVYTVLMCLFFKRYRSDDP